MYPFHEQLVRNGGDIVERRRVQAIVTALDWTDKALSAGRRFVLYEEEELEIIRRDGQFNTGCKPVAE